MDQRLGFNLLVMYAYLCPKGEGGLHVSLIHYGIAHPGFDPSLNWPASVLRNGPWNGPPTHTKTHYMNGIDLPLIVHIQVVWIHGMEHNGRWLCMCITHYVLTNYDYTPSP